MPISKRNWAATDRLTGGMILAVQVQMGRRGKTNLAHIILDFLRAQILISQLLSSNLI